MPSQLAGYQAPITAFFTQGSSQSRRVAQTRSNRGRGGRSRAVEECREPPKKKAKLKENLAPSARASDAARFATASADPGPSVHRQTPQSRHKPAVVETAGFATPAEEPVEGAEDGTTTPPVLTESNTPPRRKRRFDAPSYLPTPATTNKHRSSISPPLELSPARERFTFRSTLPGRAAATPVTFTSARKVQLPTPATPTRNTKVTRQAESSPLSSPPQSPTANSVQGKDAPSVVPNVRIAPNPAESQTVIPSSQTQALDINPFLSPKGPPPFGVEHVGHFKLPSLPKRDGCSLPSCPSSPSNNRNNLALQRDEAWVVPSSQSQDLDSFFASAFSPTSIKKRNGFSYAGRGPIGVHNSELIPSSQASENETESFAVDNQKRTPQAASRHWHGSPNRVDVAQGCTPREPSSPLGRHATLDDIVPTSQYMFEKELSSSDFTELPGALGFASLSIPTDDHRGTSSSLNSPKSTADADVIPRASMHHVFRTPRAKRIGREARTPSCHERRDGTPRRTKDMAISNDDSEQTAHKLTVQRPVCGADDPEDDTGDAVLCASPSSQTEPESPQWHIPTQHFQSSQTEPESSQWRIATQLSSQTEPESPQWHIKTQSSLTEPESSQWHIPTQHTPSRSSNRHRAKIADDDEGDDISQSHRSHSLPVASYDDHDRAPATPRLASPKQASPSTEIPDEYIFDMMREGRYPSDPSFVRKANLVRDRYLAKHPDFQPSGGDHEDQQSFISGSPLSIPGDLYDSLLDQLEA